MQYLSIVEIFYRISQIINHMSLNLLFKCLAIVDEYYPEIYEYLTKGLNSNIVCQMGGICPTPDKVLQVYIFLSLIRHMLLT